MTSGNRKLISLTSALLVLVGYFLPWVNWAGSKLNGAALPSGEFFEVSETSLGLNNPFPQFNFATLLFWIVPILAAVIFILILINRRPGILPAILTLIAVSEVSFYILFTCTIIEQVGVVKSLLPALQIGLYATVIGSVGIILAGIDRKTGLKAAFLIIGPLITWLGYTYLSKEVFKGHDDTKTVKADYSLDALSLLNEFKTNDSVANAKYKEKILEVSGRIAELKFINDSTANIKFNEPGGSYLIFNFAGKDAEEAKTVKENDSLSIKASCSGGEYSRILDVHYITFKRSVISKK